MFVRLHRKTRRMVSYPITFGVLTIATLSFANLFARADEPIPPGYRAVTLNHVRAADFATDARSMLGQAKVKAEVVVDRSVNRVLIKGSDQAVQLVSQFAETVDFPESPKPTAKASSDVVKGYKVSAEQLEPLTSRLQKKFPASSKARITFDRRTNQVIVVAPANVQSQIDQYIRQESKGTDGDQGRETPRTVSSKAPGETGIYQLRNLSWREFEDSLRALYGTSVNVSTSRNGELASVKMPQTFGDRELVQIDRRNDVVNVPGGDGVTQSWQRLIKALDAPPDSNLMTQLTVLRKADPNKVQKAVHLMQQASEQSQQQGQTTATTPLGPNGRKAGPAFVANVFQNRQGQDPAARNQPQLNQPGQATGNTDEDDKASPLEDGGLIGEVQLEFVPELGILVVRGHKRDVERVMKVIEEIERQSRETKPDVQIVVLEHANSIAMSEMLQEIYDQIFAPRQGAVSITGLGKPNAILAIGRKEALEDVVKIIHQLDVPVIPSSQFEVFALKYANSATVEDAITRFFQDRGGLGTRVVVVSEARSNSLIAQASPRDMAEIRGIIAKLDVGTTPSANEVKVFRLKNALAQDLANVLTGVISGGTTGAGGQGQQGGFQGQPGGGGGGGGTGLGGNQANRQSAVSMLLLNPKTGELIRSGILSDVRVRADTNGNSLVVTAPPESMDLIAAIIQELDQLPGGEAQLKVFTLENGDAQTLGQMLQQLFGQQVTIGQGSGGLFGGGGFANQLGNQTVGAGTEGSLVPLRFAVDVRTQSIIASGSSADLKVVEAILTRLDAGNISTRKMKVVRLKNAYAQDVATSITTLLNNQRQINQQNQLFSQAVPVFEQVEREILVVPEAATNSLVISATPRYFDDILRVISELDYRPPMVLVQVLIAEVTLSDLYEFGVELGLQDSLLFDRGKAGLNGAGYDSTSNPGFNFNNAGTNGPGLTNSNNRFQGALAGQSLTNFATGRTNAAKGYGGLVLSAANESVNILLRALEESGKIQVLSRPEVMAIHNRQAQVLVGEIVPRVQGSTINQQGNVQNSVNDVNVGLQLNIIPQINDDGVVILSVNAGRSALGAEADGVQIATTPQGQPIRSPRIINTSATTTISARSGQTVVFAGLISDEKTVTERRVPYLSDIPLLGELFKFKSDNQVRKELLIVMTPHIVKDDADYDWVKGVESERMNWCLGDVVAIHGEVGLRGGSCLFCTNHIPTIQPDITPLGMDMSAPPMALPDGNYVPQMESYPTPAIQVPAGPTSYVPPPVNVAEDPAANAQASWQGGNRMGTRYPVRTANQRPAANQRPETNTVTPYGPEPDLQPAPVVRLGSPRKVGDPNANAVQPSAYTQPTSSSNRQSSYQPNR